MFGIGTPEIIGIVIITLLVYGPDKLPDMIKKVVGFLRQIKHMSDEVTETVTHEIHKIERSAHIQEARHLIEQNRALMADTTKEIQASLNQPIVNDVNNDQQLIEKKNDDEPTQ